MKMTKELYHSILHEDFPSFVAQVFETLNPGETFHDNWHIEAICEQLERSIKGPSQGLIITVPPRSLKSTIVSVAYVAWLLGRDPTRKILCLSYNIELAAKFSNDTRMVMQSLWYREIFPGTRIDSRKNTETEFHTTRRGYRLASSVGGTLTGRGGDIIIIDDPLKAEDGLSKSKREALIQWFQNTVLSRLNDKRRGKIILVMQRLHLGDLAGHLLDAGGWDHLNLPAIAVYDQILPLSRGRIRHRKQGDVLNPNLEPIEVLDHLKKNMGSFRFSAQYQQEPVPEAGNLIRKEWFHYYDEIPPEAWRNGKIIQSWDTAMKDGEQNDYSVCTTWLRDLSTGKLYLIGVFRKRMEFPDLMKKAITLNCDLKGDLVLVEDASSGIPLYQHLRSVDGISVRSVRPVGDKVTRMMTPSLMIEGGRVLFPRKAPWLEEFERELLQFPEAAHDDQADSLSQFLNWVYSRERIKTISGPIRWGY